MEEEIEKYCPRCWRALPPDVAYCPLCGVKAEIEPFSRPRLLTIAGLMATFAGGVGIIGGFLSMLSAFTLSNFYAATGQFDLGRLLMHVVVGLFDFVGFTLGSIAGTYSWRKTNFRSAMVAIALLSLVGLLNLMVLDVHRGFGLFWLWAISVPIVILSLLSFIFIVIKQKEFK